jgi:hypothetical protein
MSRYMRPSRGLPTSGLHSEPLPEEDLARLELITGERPAHLRLTRDPAVAIAMGLPPHIFGGACGDTVFVRPDLEGRDRDFVMAHEVYHLLTRRMGCGSEHEDLANAFALNYVAEDPEPLRAPLASSDTSDRAAAFNAWEHRLLGDCSLDDLVSVAIRGNGWQDVLSRQLNYLNLWRSGTDGVTRPQMAAALPLATIVTFGNGFLATTGELNALAGDYVIRPSDLTSVPPEVVLPLLQEIRQESYNRLAALMGQTDPVNFVGAVMPYPGTGLVGLVQETKRIEALTVHLGANHYQGALARNACHFAPFSWFRWRKFHTQARDLAAQAHAAAGDQRAALVNQAWTVQAFAEHFYQDSFAAGHLVNKTLIMQWFASWAANTKYFVANWAEVEQMTAAVQPDLSGPTLYPRGAQGPSVDPQTVEELTTLDERIAGVPLQISPGGTTRDAYFAYLDFLTSAAVQLSSNQVHNHFNENSLEVDSFTRQSPFRIYGDESLLSDGAHVGIISGALAEGRTAITSIINDGASGTTAQDLLDLLPTQVLNATQIWVDLHTWHDDALRTVCETELFGGWRTFASMFAPTLGAVSIDQITTSFETLWMAKPPGAASVISVAADADGLVAASNGTAYKIDASQTSPPGGAITQQIPIAGAGSDLNVALTPTSCFVGGNGAISCLDRATFTQSWAQTLTTVAGAAVSIWPVDAATVVSGACGQVCSYAVGGGQLLWKHVLAANSYEVRIGVSADQIYAGCNGEIYAIAADGSTVVWSRSLTVLGGGMTVNVLITYANALVVSCRGYIYVLDAATGGILTEINVAGAQGEVTLAGDGTFLYAGAIGNVTAYSLDDWTLAWSTSLSVTPTYVGLDVAGGSVVAACNGYLYTLSPQGGKVFTNSLSGAGFAAASLADNNQTIFCGINGSVYAVAIL